MKTYITKSAEETIRLGQDVGKTIKNSTLIALYGDLGSGKTTFVQGFAKGLGIEKRLISPTFIIMRTYEIKGKRQRAKGKNTIQKSKMGKFYHVDLYRTQNGDDIRGIGLDEIIKNNQDIVVVEWAEKLGEFLPDKRIDIHFKHQDNERIITVDKK